MSNVQLTIFETFERTSCASLTHKYDHWLARIQQRTDKEFSNQKKKNEKREKKNEKTEFIQLNHAFKYALLHYVQVIHIYFFFVSLFIR